MPKINTYIFSASIWTRARPVKRAKRKRVEIRDFSALSGHSLYGPTEKILVFLMRTDTHTVFRDERIR